MERIRDGTLTIPCIGLITDREERGCVSLAREFLVPVEIVERRAGEDRASYDRRVDAAVIKLCDRAGVNRSGILIALMGWMRILSPWFVQRYPRRILNVHPSLLPKFPGTHAHDAVLAAKERESGMTVHYVDEGLDTGDIIEQKKCSVLPDDTVETLRARVQALECEWFPKVLQKLGEEIVTQR